jgi:competence protein ComEA
MLPEIKKQHLIIFVVMLALLFGGGVTYGRYLEKKALPPVSLTWADDSLTEKGNAQGYEGEPKNLQKAQVEVLVHVAGAVERPGVYTLPEGSRIIDAVELAQPKTDADLNKINLAKKINDQEMIIVPGFGEEGNESVVHPASIGSSSNSPVSAEVGGLININTASQAELETLPGIVEELNVLKQRFLRFFSRFKLCLINEFTLKNTVKGLNTSVVVTVSFSAHAAYHFVLV